MLRHATLVALLTAAAIAPAGAWELTSYAEEVRLETNGSRAVTLTLEFPPDAPTSARLPLAHRAARVRSVSPVGVVGRLEDLVGASELVVERDPASRIVVVEIAVAGKAAKAGSWGLRALSHELVNTAEPAIARYSAELLLPEGFAVAGIDETVPDDSASTSATARLVRRDARRGVLFSAGRLELGGRAAVRLRYRPDRRSPVVAGVLGALALAYLVGFRGLVAKGRAPRDGEGG